MKKLALLPQICLVLSITTALQLGCATTGSQRSEKAHTSAEELHQEYGTLMKQIEDTVYALDGVVAAGDVGLKTAYDRYVAEFRELESQTKVVIKHSEHLRKNTKAYLVAWKEQMAAVQNPEIRKHTEQRLARAEEQMREAGDELTRLSEDYQTFLGTLTEINIVLDNDLNPAGVKALSDIINQVQRDAKPIVLDIDTIMQALAGISQALSTGTPAEG